MPLGSSRDEPDAIIEADDCSSDNTVSFLRARARRPMCAVTLPPRWTARRMPPSGPSWSGHGTGHGSDMIRRHSATALGTTWASDLHEQVLGAPVHDPSDIGIRSSDHARRVVLGVAQHLLGFASLVIWSLPSQNPGRSLACGLRALCHRRPVTTRQTADARTPD